MASNELALQFASKLDANPRNPQHKGIFERIPKPPSDLFLLLSSSLITSVALQLYQQINPEEFNIVIRGGGLLVAAGMGLSALFSDKKNESDRDVSDMVFGMGSRTLGVLARVIMSESVNPDWINGLTTDIGVTAAVLIGGLLIHKILFQVKE